MVVRWKLIKTSDNGNWVRMLEDKYDLMSKMVMRPIEVPTEKRNERGNRGKGGARGAGAGGDNTW